MVQVMVAEVAVTLLEVTALIPGGETAAAERSSSAGAAQGAGLETEVQATEVAVAAVLSHKAIST